MRQIMNKNIIIAILIVVIIALIAVFAFQPNNGKVNTEIKFIGESTLKNGGQIQIELSDAQGNKLSGQLVNFTYTSNGVDEKYSVYTDKDGKAYLVLENEPEGEHQVVASFNGTDKYNPCNATQKITITSGEEKITSTDNNSTASTIANDNSTHSNQGSSSSGQTLFYDAELNVYYDQNGIIHGGQTDGASIYDARNNRPVPGLDVD